MNTNLVTGHYDGGKSPLHYGKRINIDNPDVVRNWCKIFGCAKDELKEAVKVVGDSEKAIRVYFN